MDLRQGATWNCEPGWCVLGHDGLIKGYFFMVSVSTYRAGETFSSPAQLHRLVRPMLGACISLVYQNGTELPRFFRPPSQGFQAL